MSVDEDAYNSTSQGSTRAMRPFEASKELRPVLLTLLQTGGVPSQMAEGIADILEEAGYKDFRPTDEVTLRGRKARMRQSTRPDTLSDTFHNTSTELTADPETRAKHRHISFERIAAHNHTQVRLAPFLLTQDMRV